MSVEVRVQRHFHADAPRFDAIYHERKGLIRHFIDDVWRGVINRRFELTLQKLDPLDGKSVLDVGCGSGRYCFAYAEGGASRVLGVDFAAGMIELAEQMAHERGIDNICEFRQGSFPECVSEDDFDVSTAMGFFDYIEQPEPLIRRMRELTRQAVVMSFPRAREWRVPLRRLRFWWLGCPLFLYTEEKVRGLLEAAGFSDYEWIELDRDYIAIARV